MYVRIQTSKRTPDFLEFCPDRWCDVTISFPCHRSQAKFGINILHNIDLWNLWGKRRSTVNSIVAFTRCTYRFICDWAWTQHLRTAYVRNGFDPSIGTCRITVSSEPKSILRDPQNSSYLFTLSVRMLRCVLTFRKRIWTTIKDLRSIWRPSFRIWTSISCILLEFCISC